MGGWEAGRSGSMLVVVPPTMVQHCCQTSLELAWRAMRTSSEREAFVLWLPSILSVLPADALAYAFTELLLQVDLHIRVSAVCMRVKLSPAHDVWSHDAWSHDVWSHGVCMRVKLSPNASQHFARRSTTTFRACQEFRWDTLTLRQYHAFEVRTARRPLGVPMRSVMLEV